MSWLTGIAGKAEHLLNSLDNSASEALNNGQNCSSSSPIPTEPYVVKQDSSPSITASQSAPSNTVIHKSGSKINLNTTVASAKGKNRDDELMDFLNSSDPATPQSKSSGHSRGSSISKGASDRPDTASVDDGIGSVSVVSAAEGICDSSNFGGNSSEAQLPDSGNVTSINLENKLLRSELLSLNHEVSSLLKRNHKSEEDVKRLRGQVDSLRDQLRLSDRELREVRSVEVDLTERIQVKESQILALRQEYDLSRNDQMRYMEELERLRGENASIRNDHSSSSDVQSQALEDLRNRVAASEAAVDHEREAMFAVQSENDRLRRSLEEAKMREMELVQQRSRSGSEEKRKLELLTSQHNVLRMKYEALEKELHDYKEKASKILAMKEKVINGLKFGDESVSGNVYVGSSTEAECGALRHERDLLREEIQRCKLEIERLQLDLQEMEYSASHDADELHRNIEMLETENAREKQVRLDSQEELSQIRREHQYLQEKSIKSKTEFAERLASKEGEIERLRGMLRLKANQTESNEELEVRIRALTENLIQKQTAVDAVNAEKHSLQVKLERVQAEYGSLERSHIALRANMGSEMNNIGGVNSGSGNGPEIVRINMADAPLTRKVKGYVNTLDTFGVRLGVFLRRYPIARIFFIVYCIILHFWVAFVLLTYQPEIHLSGSHVVGLPVAPAKDPNPLLNQESEGINAH